MEASRDFVRASVVEEWRHVLSLYPTVLKLKASKKSKAGASDELIRLDSWYQETLPNLIQERKSKHITHEELVKLMTWKLTRGKFRPRLIELAGSNKADDVESLSRKAFSCLESGGNKKKVRDAIEHLSKLKGVGPATASAILAAGCPGQAAFMADEPAICLLQATGLKYNLTEYLVYVDRVWDCLETLREQDPEFDWTAHKVELTLWTHVLAGQYDLDLHMKPQQESAAADETNKGVKRSSAKTNNNLKKTKR